MADALRYCRGNQRSNRARHWRKCPKFRFQNDIDLIPRWLHAIFTCKAMGFDCRKSPRLKLRTHVSPWFYGPDHAVSDSTGELACGHRNTKLRRGRLLPSKQGHPWLPCSARGLLWRSRFARSDVARVLPRTLFDVTRIAALLRILRRICIRRNRQETHDNRDHQADFSSSHGFILHRCV